MHVRALAPLLLLPVVATFAVSDRGSAPPASASRSGERAVINDNRRAAGVLGNGSLTLNLDARLASWHPDGDSAPGTEVPAFAEVGGAPSIPAPLIRVPAGTRVVATVRNSLPNDTLLVHGLYSRGPGRTANAPIRLAPGERREVEFQLDAPGTYYYWATTMGRPLALRIHEDGQLSGAIIVDPSGTKAPIDRVFVLGMWSDSTGVDVPHGRKRILFVINGRSWPRTERLAYTVGDTVRWHVINTTADIHPMHLHGFYFRVDSRGDGVGDTSYAEPRRDRIVTELMQRGQTMRMSWVPERDGNWAFHCHIPDHIAHRGSLGVVDRNNGDHGGNHAEQGMSNLVLGVLVSPRRGEASTATTGAPGRRKFRLVVDEKPNGTTFPTLSFALGEAGAEPKPVPEARLGPPIVVNVGEPVSVTVINRSSHPTAVHWHGIELESYFDGIAGFSGTPARLAPVIAPRDSFEARFTPPRPGTFIYHSHVDEARQQAAGLTGAIVVLAAGERFDSATNLFAVVTSPADSATETRALFINGALDPAPLALKVGTPYRLRMINITMGRPGLRVQLVQDSTVAQWRALARDGAELPEHRRVMQRAVQPLSIGQTMDVEITPRAAGSFRFEARQSNGALLGVLVLRVTP